MFQEKDFEDILSRYPELIEDGLMLKGRQVTLYGRRMDLLFEDKFKRRLIVELKRGPIKDDHIGQVMSYEGMLLSSDDPSIRIMLIGNRVPPNIRRSLDHHGIAWREISFSRLTEFLNEKKDSELLSVLEGYEESEYLKNYRSVNLSDIQPVSVPRVHTPDELVSEIKKSEDYASFHRVLDRKKENEEKAKNIILQNLGYINYENLHEVIALVDEKYHCTINGRNVSGTWFGRLLNSNTGNLFETDLSKINNWFNALTNPHLATEKKFSLLLNEPNNIKGLNVGFLTLMLYLIDKSANLIWFEGLHNGFMKIYPEKIEKFTGRVDQYLAYNKAAKEFAEKYGFDHTEIDWVFSTGVYVNVNEVSGAKVPSYYQQTTKRAPIIFEQIKEVCNGKEGSIVTSGEVISELNRKYATNPGSIILTDYCYNRMNIGTHHGKYIFEYLEPAKFRYLGEKYPYTGLIYSKPSGEQAEKEIGEWKDGIKYLKEDNNLWQKIEQTKYSIDEIFESQNANPAVRKLVAEFHRSLGNFFAEKNLNWWARTHAYGCSYFCNNRRYFLAMNISSSDFIVHYYTGNSQIGGLEKSTWSKKDDNKGSKPLHINKSEDIGKALIFAEAAYRITESESSANDYQYEYWEGFRSFMEAQKSFVKIRRPQSKNWTDISIGRSDIYLAAGFNTQKRIQTTWLVFVGPKAKKNFDFLFANLYTESLVKISPELKWERMDYNKRSAVILEKPADVFDSGTWQEQYMWFKEYLEKYETFFAPIVKSLKAY